MRQLTVEKRREHCSVRTESLETSSRVERSKELGCIPFASSNSSGRKRQKSPEPRARRGQAKEISKGVHASAQVTKSTKVTKITISFILVHKSVFNLNLLSPADRYHQQRGIPQNIREVIYYTMFTTVAEAKETVRRVLPLPYLPLLALLN